MSDWQDAEHHVERAHELYEAGRWEEAEAELREALARNPYQAEWHFNLGLTLDAGGRHEAAADAFRSAYELVEGGDAHTALMIGVCHLRIGKLNRANEWLEQAATLDPESAAPLVHRIEVFTRLGEHDQAEVMFYMAQQLDPDNAEAYATMADSLLDRRLYDRAVWCLREAARLDPFLHRVQARLAEAYAATGRLERARQLYLRELRFNPGDIDTLLELGSLLVEMNRLQEAGEKFRRVLEMEPDNTDAHFQLGLLAHRSGRLDESLTQFDVVVRLDPTYPGVRRKLAALLMQRHVQGDRQTAIQLLQREHAAMRRGTSSFEASDLDELGSLLLDAGMHREARAVLSRLLESRPSDAMAHHHLSVALFGLGELDSGMDSARQAIRLKPDLVPAMHNLALALVNQRRWTRARYWLRQAITIDPDDASLRRLRLQLRLHAIWAGVMWTVRKTSRPGINASGTEQAR